MGVAITFEKLDELTVAMAIRDAIDEARRTGGPVGSPFKVVGIFRCPRCIGLAVEYVDGAVVTCRICDGQGAITLLLDGTDPAPSSYIHRRDMIRRHLERLKELAP